MACLASMCVICAVDAHAIAELAAGHILSNEDLWCMLQSYKPLSKDAITKHLDDFGMDPEITNHNAILGLSGAHGSAWPPLFSAVLLAAQLPGLHCLRDFHVCRASKRLVEMTRNASEGATVVAGMRGPGACERGAAARPALAAALH